VAVERIRQVLHEVAVEQLQRGHVHGDAQRRPARRAPPRGMLDRRLHDPFADLADEAAFFRDRQEGLR
jgi:hypothetical protein